MLLERLVINVGKKKTVLVIVEGVSDEEALGMIFSNLYDKNSVYVKIMHSDITSDYRNRPELIISRIGKIIKDYLKEAFLKKNDFQEVIHLVDMDGAFAPDDCIVEDPNKVEVFYSPTEIKTNKVDKIIKRNLHKRQCLNRLRSTPEVMGIPYRIYYMSCNLDHVLYNKQNSTDEEKESDAHAFAKKYKSDLDGFLGYISDSDFSVIDDYTTSWEYITQGKRSLERHSNLGICFKDIREKRKLVSIK